MKYEEVMKKLEEIKVDAYNNLSSGEEESELQVESSTEEPNEEPAGGEEIKVKTPKPENVKAPKTLSRTTPMDGGKGADESVYLNDATLKATRQKLDGLKDVLKNAGDAYASKITNPMSVKYQKAGEKAWMILEEAKQHPERFQGNENDLKELQMEWDKGQMRDYNKLDAINQRFTQG